MKKHLENVDKVITEILKGITETQKNILPEEQKNIIRLLVKNVWFKENEFKIEISKYSLKNLIKAKGKDISILIDYKLKKCKEKSMVLFAEGEVKKKKKGDTTINSGINTSKIQTINDYDLRNFFKYTDKS